MSCGLYCGVCHPNRKLVGTLRRVSGGEIGLLRPSANHFGVNPLGGQEGRELSGLRWVVIGTRVQISLQTSVSGRGMVGTRPPPPPKYTCCAWTGGTCGNVRIATPQMQTVCRIFNSYIHFYMTTHTVITISHL